MFVQVLWSRRRTTGKIPTSLYLDLTPRNKSKVSERLLHWWTNKMRPVADFCCRPLFAICSFLLVLRQYRILCSLWYNCTPVIGLCSYRHELVKFQLCWNVSCITLRVRFTWHTVVNVTFTILNVSVRVILNCVKCRCSVFAIWFNLIITFVVGAVSSTLEKKSSIRSHIVAAGPNDSCSSLRCDVTRNSDTICSAFQW